MLRFDPFAPQVRINPYPAYHRLRAEAPVHWCAADAWLVTSYVEAERLLNHPQLSHWKRGLLEPDLAQRSPFEYYSSRWLNCFNPHRHSSVKTIFTRLLSVGRLEEIARNLEKTAHALIDTVAGVGEMDAIADFAVPLTLSVACELFGVRPEEQPLFLQRMRSLNGNLFDALAGSTQASKEAQAFLELLHQMVQRRQREPGQDLLSALLQIRDETAEVQGDDVIPFCLFFLFASHDNMVNFIGNSLLALLCHPDQWQELTEQPHQVETAIEELLRYDSPVQLIWLTAQAEISTSTTLIQANEDVLVAIAAANRDPDRFEQPDCLNISRSDTAHLSFGSGPMRCLGARLARLEGAIALRTLTQCLKRLNFGTEKLQWRHRPEVLRGLTALPITFEVR